MTFIDRNADPTFAHLAVPRASLTIQVRLVDNGCVISVGGTGQQFEPVRPAPERVATTVDQAVEHIRELLQKAWPK